MSGLFGELSANQYGWAERACEAGMPEREAMSHLGHNSLAVHRAYAHKARNVTMPLEFYEREKQGKIVKFQQEDMGNSRFLRAQSVP